MHTTIQDITDHYFIMLFLIKIRSMTIQLGEI